MPIGVLEALQQSILMKPERFRFSLGRRRLAQRFELKGIIETVVRSSVLRSNWRPIGAEIPFRLNRPDRISKPLSFLSLG